MQGGTYVEGGDGVEGLPCAQSGAGFYQMAGWEWALVVLPANFRYRIVYAKLIVYGGRDRESVLGACWFKGRPPPK